MSGCVAYNIQDEDRRARDSGDPVYVIPAPYSGADNQAEEFAKTLSMANGLRMISPQSGIDLPAEAVVVELKPDTLRCFSEPMLTVLTLGIIPDVNCGAYGYSFNLATADKAVEVDNRGEVTSVFGWAGVFMQLLPDWTGETGFAQYNANELEKAIRAALDESTE